MDESGIKGLESSNSDAEIRESSVARICVEGYNTSLHAYDVHLGLRELFASCGEVIHVYFPGYGLKTNSILNILNRFALVYIRGKHAEKKALKLSGFHWVGHMGPLSIVVKPYSFQAKYLDPILAATRDVDNMRQRRMEVMGFDTSLPKKVVETTLLKHFSKCGPVGVIHVRYEDEESKTLAPKAVVCVSGEDTVEKALQLGGCDVTGFKNIHVYLVAGPLKRDIGVGFDLSKVFASKLKRRKLTE
uniref:Nucleolin 1 n=1 Tax=Noccaea caerulescens TaxID=107243 RepID=A0A1J3FAX6_NOCCA